MAVSIAQRVQYAYAAGFRNGPAVEALTIIVAISLAECGVGSRSGCEGGCNPDCCPQSVSCGVLQVFQLAHPGTAACASDPACCFRLGYSISSSGTRFSPWSTYNSGAFRQYLTPVRQAIQALPPPIGGGAGGGCSPACDSCHSCVNGQCVPLTCPAGYACVNGQCVHAGPTPPPPPLQDVLIPFALVAAGIGGIWLYQRGRPRRTEAFGKATRRERSGRGFGRERSRLAEPETGTLAERLSAVGNVSRALPAPSGGLRSSNAFILPDGRVVSIGAVHHADSLMGARLGYDEVLDRGVVRFGSWGDEAFFEARAPLTQAQQHTLANGLRELRAGGIAVLSGSSGNRDDEVYERAELDDRSGVGRLLRTFADPRTFAAGRSRARQSAGGLRQRLAHLPVQPDTQNASFIGPDGTIYGWPENTPVYGRDYGHWDVGPVDELLAAGYIRVNGPTGFELVRPMTEAQRQVVLSALERGGTTWAGIDVRGQSVDSNEYPNPKQLVAAGQRLARRGAA